MVEPIEFTKGRNDRYEVKVCNGDTPRKLTWGRSRTRKNVRKTISACRVRETCTYSTPKMGSQQSSFHCSGLNVLVVLNLRFTDYRFVVSDADIGRVAIALNVLCQQGNERRVGHFEMQQLLGDRIDEEEG